MVVSLLLVCHTFTFGSRKEQYISTLKLLFAKSEKPTFFLLLLTSEWKLAAYGRFFCEENILVLEARSILYAVRFAE